MDYEVQQKKHVHPRNQLEMNERLWDIIGLMSIRKNTRAKKEHGVYRALKSDQNCSKSAHQF